MIYRSVILDILHFTYVIDFWVPHVHPENIFLGSSGGFKGFPPINIEVNLRNYYDENWYGNQNDWKMKVSYFQIWSRTTHQGQWRCMSINIKWFLKSTLRILSLYRPTKFFLFLMSLFFKVIREGYRANIFSKINCNLYSWIENSFKTCPLYISQN